MQFAAQAALTVETPGVTQPRHLSAVRRQCALCPTNPATVYSRMTFPRRGLVHRRQTFRPRPPARASFRDSSHGDPALAQFGPAAGPGCRRGSPGPVAPRPELRELMLSGLVGSGAVTGAGNPAVGGLGRLTPMARTGLILLTGVLVTLVALQVSMWWDDGSEPAGSAISGAVGVTGATTDWAAVVQDLDSARGRALAAADPTLLAAVYGEGTPELQADTQTIQQLADQGVRVVDGVHQLVSVTVVNSAPTDSAPTPQTSCHNGPARFLASGARVRCPGRCPGRCP